MMPRPETYTLPQAGKGEICVFSDFDETMVEESTPKLLVARYVFGNPHHEPLRRRLGRAAVLAMPSLRESRLGDYYDCLRRIPAAERSRILRGVPVSARWLQAMKDLRMRHKRRVARLTIVTRNCIDVVHEWAMQNKGLLAREGIVIEAIVANGPLKDKDIALVRERGSLTHVGYVGFGHLLSKEKAALLGPHAVYVGDKDDALLAPLVKEYVRL